ncbi:hypothetical protein ANN_05353 [Periplaneta americana]|uniref:Uncharacterized protein n=1 Tax=Periplaneta americana TaxID=6978 RepID=A0ABQ8TBS4_PERAM|nr:hypothetical protein ANN_05353 [Periplaneta americana]
MTSASDWKSFVKHSIIIICLLNTETIKGVVLNGELRPQDLKLATFVSNIIVSHITKIPVLVSSQCNERITSKEFRTLGASSSICDIQDSVLRMMSEEMRWPIEVQKDTHANIRHYYTYVLFCGKNINVLFQQIRKFIDPYIKRIYRCRLIVMVTSDVEIDTKKFAIDIKNIVWNKYFVSEALLIFAELKSASLVAYTWVPYSSETQCKENIRVIEIGQWINSQMTTLQTTFLLPVSTGYKNFHGCPVKFFVGTKNYKWLTNEKKFKSIIYYDYMVDIILLASKTLNLSLIYDPMGKEVERYGFTFFLLFKLFEDDYVTITDTVPIDYGHIADKIASHKDIKFKWFVPCAIKLSRMEILTKIFRLDVWFLIILFYVSTASFLWAVRKYLTSHMESAVYMKFSDNLLSMWAVTLGVSTWELPQTSSLRICFISFVWYCYALVTIYVTFFTSLLVDPGFGRQIMSFDEIMHSGIVYGYDPFLKYFFDGDNVGIRLKNTVDSYVNCTDRLHCFDRVSISRDFALYDTTEALNYYLVKNEDVSVCAIDEFTFTFQRNFYFRLGSNFFDHFNRVVTDLKESGLFQKIMDDYYRKLKVEHIELDEFHRIEDTIIRPADRVKHTALYPTPDVIRNIKSRRLRWAGHVARMDGSRNAYRVLVGRPEGKRPLGRPRRRWEDSIKMDLREVGYDDRDWINLAQDRDRWRAYVRAAMNLRVP